RRWLVAFCLVAACASERAALGADATASDVQPATAVAPAMAAAKQGPATPGVKVRFDQRETAVGDRVVQRLGMQLGVTTKIVQSGQIAHQSASEIRSQQQRTIDVLQV